MTALSPLDYNVCYADTDAAGVVYHGRYIEMAERSRMASVHGAGFTQEHWNTIRELGFLVRAVHTRHHQFAVLNDRLTVRSAMHRLTPARCWWISRVQRGADLVCTVAVEVIFYHRVRQQPVLLDETLKAAFEQRGFVRPDEDLRRYFPWLS